MSDRHDLHSYASERDSGLITLTCSCGWRSPAVESIPHGIDVWSAHVSDAFAEDDSQGG